MDETLGGDTPPPDTTPQAPQRPAFVPPPGAPDDPTAQFSIEKHRTPPSEFDTADLASPMNRVPEDVPSDDGGFVFRRIVGQGGYGVVWEGVQKSLRRVVAIKRVRAQRVEEAAPDPARAETLANTFRSEAFASAQLDHPNIVPVYDMGEDERGLPLLAMKLVDGKPWDRLLQEDFPALPMEEFLARHLPILLDVAQAAAFAHSRGIVHRDLKPSQVMVGEFGEVLLMDWGLAVSIDSPSPAATGGAPSGLDPLTPTRESASNPAGTPSYMAPEQTEDTAANIGPWTDVYLLGGTLFTLLTGGYPHPGPGIDRAMHQAMQGEVADPATVAPGREMPEELLALMREALVPDHARRTLTARQFVQRIRDYLSGAGNRRESQVITAAAAARLATGTRDYEQLGECIGELARARALWPRNPEVDRLRQGALETFGRAALDHGDFVLARVQANRLDPGDVRDRLLADISRAESTARNHARTRRAALVGVMALVLIIAVGTLLFNQRLQREISEKAIARANAEEARGDAEDLIGFMLGDLKDQLEPISRLPVMEGVAVRAKGYYDKHQPGANEPEQLLRKVRALRQLAELRYAEGKYTEAATLAQDSLALSGSLPEPRSPETLAELARATCTRARVQEAQGTGQLALNGYTSTIKLWDSLVATSPADIEPLRGLADAWCYLGDCQLSQGILADALASYAKALSSFEGLAKKEPHNTRWQAEISGAHHRIGHVHRAAGRLDDALTSFRLARDIDQRVVDAGTTNTLALEGLAAAWHGAGRVLTAQRHLNDALENHRKGLDLDRALAAIDPANALWQRALGEGITQVAITLKTQGKLEEALQAFVEYRAVMEALVRRDPTNIEALAAVATSWDQAAWIFAEQRRTEESRRAYATSLEIGARILALEPANTRWQRKLAMTHSLLGDLLHGQLRDDEALEHFEASRVLREKLVAEHPETPDFVRDLSFSWKYISTVRESQYRFEEALEAQEKAIALRTRLDKVADANPAWQQELAYSWDALGGVLEELGRPAEAQEKYEKARAILEPRAGRNPEDIALVRDYSMILGRIGHALEAQEKYDEALPHFLKACDQAEATAALPKPPDFAVRYLGLAWTQLGELYRKMGRLDESRTALEKARAAWQPLIDVPTPRESDQSRWSLLQISVGLLERDTGHADSARAAWERALAASEPIYKKGHADIVDTRRYALILAFLGRKDEARPIIDDLWKKGDRDVLFLASLKEAGVSP